MLHLRLLLSSLVLCCGCLAPAAVVEPRQTAPEESPAEIAPPPEPAILAITFDDLDVKMEPDTLFEEWMLTQRVRDLDGQRVRISGFMLPGFANVKIRQFILLREKECPYGVGGQAHHVIAVTLQQASATYSTEAQTVEGVLSIQPFTGYNGNTWSLYAIDDATLN